MTTIIQFSAAFIALCVIVWLLLSPRVSTFLYHKRLFARDQEAGSMQSLWSFNACKNNELFFRTFDGTLLHGWFFEHPGSAKVFLYNIGRSSDIARCLPYVQVMLEAGASVFIYEYRGFGMSSGKPTLWGICEDGLAAFDFLSGRMGYAPGNIVLYGESLGAGVAAHITSLRKAAGLIMQSGFASLSCIGKEMFAVLRVYPNWLFPRPSLDNLKAVSQEHPPLLIMHGVKDEVVPVHHSLLIAESASEPKQLVHLPNSAHRDLDGVDRPAFVSTLSAFLNRLSKPGSERG